MSEKKRFSVDTLLSPSFAKTLDQDKELNTAAVFPQDIFKIDVSAYLADFAGLQTEAPSKPKERAPAALQPLNENTTNGRVQRDLLGIKQNPLQAADLRRRQAAATASRFGFTKH